MSRRANTPDAQHYDEVRLVTVPRYKTSHLSGDEWRISHEVHLYRKGTCVRTITDWRCVDAIRKAVAGRGAHDDGLLQGVGNICDQESCTAEATVVYKLKKLYAHDGTETDPYASDCRPLVRMFCAEHSTRGDCGLEDADDNYELLEGTPQEPDPAVKRRAGMIIL